MPLQRRPVQGPESSKGTTPMIPKQTASAQNAKLSRSVFHTSREMDFFSEKELVTQTGHCKLEWPLVIVKELVDNALDAAEEGDIAPVIDVAADAGGISVQDNGPGLPEETLQCALDFTVRASNREAYVSPCRGAQGNALKTLLPMPWVVDPEHGKLIITAHGKRHEIRCGADPISQRPVIRDHVADLGKGKNSHRANNGKPRFVGTEVRLEWGPRADSDGRPLWPFDDLCVLGGDWDSFPDRFRALVEGFAVFNPHATFVLSWFGKKTTWRATDPGWTKWKPCHPTSAHWYELPHLERLIGAYVTLDRERGTDRLVSDLIEEFDGLTGSGKRTKVLNETGLKRSRLADLVVADRLDSEKIEKLLHAMRRHSKPVKPQRLGIIGEDHLKKRLLEMGVKPESFRYSRKLSTTGKSKNPQSNGDDKPRFDE